VIGHLCGLSTEGLELPDAGEGLCCMGAAVYGPERCTCWEPIYDRPQQPPDEAAEGEAQPRPCRDCAYRPGSPERSGAEHVTGDQGLLDSLVVNGRPFYCHAGMRRVLALVHGPTGVRVERGPDAYDPATGTDRRVYQADGQPALVCGGWLALRMAYLQRDQEVAG
jgi:hypothetical protein